MAELYTPTQADIERRQTKLEAPFAKQFGSVITAMVTPMRSSGEIDWYSAGRLITHLEATGSTGLLIAGTTGESATISHGEQRDLFEWARDMTDLPILAGTGSNNTTEAIALTSHVRENNLADAVLVVSPYYNRPTQYGIGRYFETVAQAADGLPVMMYDIPGRTGVSIAYETIVRLASTVGNIVALKDAAGDNQQTAELLSDSRLPDDFVVYSGNDPENCNLGQHGAVGAVSVASHYVGPQIRQVFDSLSRGEDEAAAAIQQAIQETIDYQSSDKVRSPEPTKIILEQLGVIAYGNARPPMQSAPEDIKDCRRQAEYLISRYSLASGL